jgi:hypothetical protein
MSRLENEGKRNRKPLSAIVRHELSKLLTGETR